MRINGKHQSGGELYLGLIAIQKWHARGVKKLKEVVLNLYGGIGLFHAPSPSNIADMFKTALFFESR